MKRLLALLLFAIPVMAQTTVNGTMTTGPAAARPACSLTFNAATLNEGDVYNDSDDVNAWKCQGGTWQAFGNGGGGGSTPGGNPGQAQYNNGGVLGGIPGNGYSTSAGTYDTGLDYIFKGANPYVDLRDYGVRAIVPGSSYVVNATCVASNSTVALGAAGSFVNGDGVDLYGCGAAHAMSTPAAPVITVSLAAAGTGTNYTVPAAAGGSTTTCYRIPARDKAQGLTAASSEVCITGWTPGAGNIAITTASRTNNVTTYNVASTGPLAAGASVCVNGTSNDLEFGGCFNVTAVGSGFFTVSTGNYTQYGSAASATGGTVYYFVCNELALPVPTGAMWQYGIYQGASGAETLYDVSLPLTVYSYEPSAQVWDDFGPTMMGTVSLPAFWPNTPPASATADSLVTTIVSGAGTTSVVLNNAPGTSVSSTMRFDNTPNYGAAYLAATAQTNGGGRLYIPVPSYATNNQYFYQTSSILDLSSVNQSVTVDQAGIMYLGDTMLLRGDWRGDIAQGSSTNSNNQYCYPQFALQPLTCFYTNTAKPGIYLVSGNISGIALSPTGNSYLSMLDINTNPHKFSNMTFAGTSGAMGIDYYYFVSTAGQGFGFQMRDVAILGGYEPSFGTTLTPALVTKNNAEMAFDRVFMSGRSLFFSQVSNSGGFSLNFDMKQEAQGGGLPMLQFYEKNNLVGWLHLYNVVQDTNGAPLAVNWGVPATLGGTLNWSVDISGGIPPSSTQPLVSGYPFGSLKVWGIGGVGSLRQVGQNSLGTSICGTGLSGCFEDANRTIVGTTSSFKAGQIANPTSAPSASVVTTCSGFPSAGSHAFAVVAWDASSVYTAGTGGSTLASPYGSPVSLNGSSNCAAIAQPTLPAGTQYWGVLDSANGFYVNAGNGSSCGPTSFIPVSITTITDQAPFYCGSGPTLNTTGAQIMSGNGVYASPLILPTVTTPPTGIAGLSSFYTDPTANWPSFKPNGNTAYILPGFSGAWASGQCAVATATANVFGLQVCGGGGGFNSITTGVNNSGQTMTVGSTSSLTYSGSGIVNARQVIGIDFNAASGCNSSTYLRGDGTCNTPAGAGNVSTSTGTQYGIPTWLTATSLGNIAPSATSGVPLIGQGSSAYPIFGAINLAGGSNIVTGLLPNANLANAATTVNSQTCTLGSTCTIPEQVNGSNLTSQAGTNYITSTTNSVGLTATPSNAGGTNTVKFEITGSSYTGQAATAAALGATPTQCSGGTPLATGIAANGNANCTAATGLTIQTNTVNNSSQTTLNVLSSSTNTTGLAFTETNTSSGNVKGEIASGVLLPAYGGTGVSGPTAHSLGIAEGSGNWTFITGTAGYCLLFNGTGADPGPAVCPGNNMSGGTQYGAVYAIGPTTITSNTPPTVNGLYSLAYNVTASAAVAPTAILAGLTGRAVTGSASTDTVVYSDALTVVDHDAAGSASVNETLPTATTLGNANFGYSYSNHSTHTDTITPTTWTINGASSLSVPANDFVRIKVDPNSATNWLADVSASALAAGVTSISGDGTLITNSSSTAAVTLTLGNAGAHKWWGNNTGSTTAPGYEALTASDMPSAIPIGNVGSSGLSGTSPIAISAAGAISCATCAIGPGSSTTGDLASFTNTNGLTLSDSAVVAANVVQQSANGTNGYVATYTGANKNLVAAQALPNGITATTQTTGDTSTDVATDQFVGNTTTNMVTAASNYTSGDLVQAAGNNKTTSDSSIATGNVVTNSTGNAAAANQVIISSAASKAVQAIDFPERYFVPAANCNNTTAGAGWSIGSGGTVACRAGTNNLGGYVAITDTAGTFAQFMVTIPEDWDTGTRPYIRFYLSSTDTTNNHTIIPQVKVSCPTAGNGTTSDDATFSAAQSSSTVTIGASAVSNGFYNGSNVQFGSTQMSGCIAGGLMIVQVGRATDTASTAYFWGADVTFPRLITVGAE
jgi:hypothetical protein